MTKYLVHSGTLSIQSPVKTGSSNNFWSISLRITNNNCQELTLYGIFRTYFKILELR